MKLPEEDILDVLQDYFDLIKALHLDGKPEKVELVEEEGEIDTDTVIVDGVRYEFSDIPHDDQTNTGRVLEIEELLCGVYGESRVAELQLRLMEKIQKEW